MMDPTKQTSMSAFGAKSSQNEPLSGLVCPRGCSDWVLDSGASWHMAGAFKRFNQPVPIGRPIPIEIPNGKMIYATRAV